MTLAQLTSLIDSENELLRPGGRAMTAPERGTAADLLALAGMA